MDNLKQQGNDLLVDIWLNVENLCTFVKGAVNEADINRTITVINHCHTVAGQITPVAQLEQEGEVDDIRAVALHAIDHFIEDTIDTLQEFFNANNLETLQGAIASLTTLNYFIKRPENFEGELTPEAQEEMEQLRAQALGAINQFRNTMLPTLRRYVNLETDVNLLARALDAINFIADTTNYDNL